MGFICVFCMLYLYARRNKEEEEKKKRGNERGGRRTRLARNQDKGAGGGLVVVVVVLLLLLLAVRVAVALVLLSACVGLLSKREPCDGRVTDTGGCASK